MTEKWSALKWGRNLVAVALFAGAAIGVPAPVFAAQSATVRLASGAAGGGTLGVFVEWPDAPELDRYPEGPPVLVQMHGGGAPGNLRSWAGLVDGQGFVVVQFVYPGGEDQGIASDGYYDVRGPLCVEAARDVWIFALGLKADESGTTIHDVVGRRVLVEAMGVSATSNGTMISPIVLATYASELAGRVRYLSLWENIGNDQIRTAEIGRLAFDCQPNTDADGNGLPNDEGKNPRYVPARDYAYDELAIDYADIAWDASATTTLNDQAGRCSSQTFPGKLFFDGNGNGSLDSLPLLAGCTDVDRDGVIELTEDWLIQNPIELFDEACQAKAFFSIAVTRHLEANPQVFPGGAWPGWVATLAEAEAFHRARTARDHYDLLAPYAATMRTISSFDRVPHFYVTEDFAEVRIEQQGLKASGLWRRLNPDAAYFADVVGVPPPGYPDADANVDIDAIPFGGLGVYAAPDETPSNDLVYPAVAELADRTYFGGWVAQLDAVLEAAGEPERVVRGVRFAGASADLIAWDAAAGNLFYDVIRGDVGALGGEGVGEVTCVEDDSTDREAAAEGAPEAGRAWFYLVRPNALFGGYGASSDGGERAVEGGQTGGDCPR